MGRKEGHGMGGPTDSEMCMTMDSHLKGEKRQKAMAGYVQHSAGASGGDVANTSH